MKKSGKKAFTLIELLIVIALLGALAVGLLAALDPFEQLKKGTDTGIRNLVSEFHGATIRYYALKSEMPWCPGGSCASVSGVALNDANMLSYIQSIVETGELKSNFSELAGNNLSKVYVTATSDSIIVCFNPVSKSFKCDPNTKYNIYGETDTVNCGNPATCGSVAANTCYWCVQ